MAAAVHASSRSSRTQHAALDSMLTCHAISTSIGSPSSGSPSIGSPSNGSPSNGSPSSGSPSNGSPSNGSPSNGSPSSASPSMASPSNGSPSMTSPSRGSPSIAAPPTPFEAPPPAPASSSSLSTTAQPPEPAPDVGCAIGTDDPATPEASAASEVYKAVEGSHKESQHGERVPPNHARLQYAAAVPGLNTASSAAAAAVAAAAASLASRAAFSSKNAVAHRSRCSICFDEPGGSDAHAREGEAGPASGWKLHAEAAHAPAQDTPASLHLRVKSFASSEANSSSSSWFTDKRCT